MNSSMPVDIQRANTAAWREEFLDLRFPEFRMSGPVDEENETLALLPGNIVMFPEFDFSIALIAGFHRSGVLCIIPISPHSAPAMEFELRLSDSAFVLQTWNTRFIRKKDIPQIIPVEKLGQDDFELALKHSRFTFEGEKFFSENIGQSLNLFDPEDEVLERYVDQQYQMFPECLFIVPGNACLETEDMVEPEDFSRQDNPDNILDIVFPGSDNSFTLEEQKAASQRKSDFNLEDLF